MTSRVLALTASCAVVVAVFVPEIAGRQGTPLARPQTPAPAALGTITKGDFRFAYDDRGISSLANPEDPFGATVTTPATTGGRGGRGGQGAPAATLGLTLSYRVGERDDWTNYTRGAAHAGGRGRERRAATRRRPARSKSSRPTRPMGTCSTGRSTWRPTGQAGPRRRSRHQRSRCRARRARRPPTSSSAASSSISSFPAPGRSSTTCARRARRRSCSSPCGPARSSNTRARGGGRGGGTGVRALREGRGRRNARHLAAAEHDARSRAAAQEGVVRIPDAVGVELRRAARPDLSRPASSTSASCRA